MSNRRPLNWSSALRDLKCDRLRRPDVREERLRRDISAWRGQSGRRYVFSTDLLTGFDADEAISTLTLFVRRDASGIAEIAFSISDPSRSEAHAALREARERGCAEVHVHRLSDADRYGAILADLNTDVLEAA